VWIVVVFLVICVGLSSFFSGSEIALSSLDKITVKRLTKEKGKKGRLIESLLMKPSRWLITILIGNNVVNIAAASLATLLVTRLVSGAPGKAVAIVTGVMTFIILVFGEIIPKRFCQQHAETISLKVASPILFLSIVLSPIIKALNFFTQAILKITGAKEAKKSPLITEKEIHTLIDIGQEEGALDEREEKLVHSALEFDETRAKQIMIPRTKMVCIEEEASLSELVDLINKVGYSRIPVYRKIRDNITGVAYAKDLLSLFDRLGKNLKVKQIMHPPIFVPYTIRLAELLHQLQKERTHLAIVVDEYGGVAGILTLEDLLEEIVGEIEDEYDRKEEKLTMQKDGSVLVKADTDIDEINEKLGTDLPEKTVAFESIGGFIFHQLGRIPRVGEVIEYNNLKITVVEADEKGVKRVKLWKKPQEKKDIL
jgi:CBS domain containing-hemolysin-like protein